MFLRSCKCTCKRANASAIMQVHIQEVNVSEIMQVHIQKFQCSMTMQDVPAIMSVHMQPGQCFCDHARESMFLRSCKYTCKRANASAIMQVHIQEVNVSEIMQVHIQKFQCSMTMQDVPAIMPVHMQPGQCFCDHASTRARGSMFLIRSYKYTRKRVNGF